jgi:type II secretory pathway component PulF
MATFKYQAVSAQGREVRGTVEAATRRQALSELSKQGLVPLSLKEDQEPQKKQLPPRELYAFTQQIANLLSAGLPLTEALEAVRQYGSRILEPVVADVLTSVRAGATLAAALAGQNFPPFYCAMVRAGEVGGNLEENLQQLAEDLENQQQVERQLKISMLYPAVMLSASIGAVALLLLFVLPRFQLLLSQFEGELPIATRLILALGNFARSWRWPLSILFLAFAAALLALRYSPQGRKLWERYSLVLPVVGPLFAKLHYVRFARTVGRLLAGGVSLPESLEIARESLDNYLLCEATGRVQEGIRKGGSFTVLLKEEGFFPALAIQMLATGERAGNLEEVLLRSSELFQKESENNIKGLLALLEPIVIAFLGLIVLTVVLAIMVPLLSINML